MQADVTQRALQRLWAPWRTARMRDGESRVPQGKCPFCHLPQQPPEHDRENLVLARYETCFVVLNAYPYNPAALMVVPYTHTGDLTALADDESVAMWRTGVAVLEAMDETLRASAFNLGMNLGAAAGGSVGDHVHLHIVPRWVGDTNFMTVTANAQVLGESLLDVWDLLHPVMPAATDRTA